MNIQHKQQKWSVCSIFDEGNVFGEQNSKGSLKPFKKGSKSSRGKFQTISRFVSSSYVQSQFGKGYRKSSVIAGVLQLAAQYCPEFITINSYQVKIKTSSWSQISWTVEQGNWDKTAVKLCSKIKCDLVTITKDQERDMCESKFFKKLVIILTKTH